MDNQLNAGGRNGAANGRPGDDARLRDLWHFVLRNRWLTLGVPVLVLAVTAVFVQIAAPVYDGAVWIRVDEQRSKLPVLDALQSLSSGSGIGTELQVLQRRPLAEEVVDSLALQLEVVRPRRVERAALLGDVRVSRDAPEAVYRLVREDDGGFGVFAADERVATARVGEPVRVGGVELALAAGARDHDEIRLRVLEFEEAVKRFRRSLGVLRPDREADLLLVRYESRDPGLAEAVPNTLARLFIRSRQDVQKTEARSTVRFLHEQLDTLNVQLVRAEDDLRVFREGERLVNVDAEAQMQVGRLGELLAERDRIDAEREALDELLAEVVATAAAGEVSPSPYRRLIAFPTLLRNFAVSELFRSLAEVENQRAELLNRRTREDPDVQVLTSRIHELEDQLRTIATTYLQGLTNHVGSLDAALDRFAGDLDRVPAREIRFARLKREAEVLEEIYVLLQTRLKEAEIAAAVEDPSVRVVEPAIYPTKPIRPNKPLSLALALVLGAVLGAGAAFGREHMDNTVHTREDLQTAADGLPVLGLIPRIREATAAGALGGNGRKAAAAARNGSLPERLVAGRDPRNPASEAYRSLRTNITFSRPERTPRTLVFTSPAPGDGKSTSAANLAITLAQQGVRCLLIDTDMRRGVLHEVFGRAREPGLSNVLLGRVEPGDAIQRVELGESGTLDFLPTGTLPPNPAELLGSPRMRSLLERLEAEYDLVVMDAPPLTLVTDAALLGTNSDGVILVARSGSTDRGGVTYAVEQLRAVRAPILGSVLNDIDARKDRYYGSYATASYTLYGE